MLDFFIIFILLIFSVLGFIRGCSKEFNSIITIILFFFFVQLYSDQVTKYLSEIVVIGQDYLPSYTHKVLSFFVIYFFTYILVYIINRLFFNHLTSFENVLLNRIFGIFLGFVKGLVIIIVLLLLLDYFGKLDALNDFDKNSLFLDYFFKFGVQLPHVWNHWYS